MCGGHHGTIACLGVLQEAILLPVDNRRYFTIGAILDNRLVLTINRTKLLDYRKNDFHLLCSSLDFPSFEM